METEFEPAAEVSSGQPRTIERVDEVKLYRVVFVDGSGSRDVTTAAVFPSDEVYVKSKEEFPLTGASSWFQARLLEVLKKRR